MTRRSLAGCLAAGMLLTTLAGCSEDESPAICSDVDSLRSSVEAVTDTDIDQGSLATLQDDLGAVRSDLSKVKSDAEDEFAPEIDDVEQAASSLSASIEAAVAAPAPQTVATVATAVQALGSALGTLDDAVDSTC